MAEWLILLIVVPAIVVPVVMLVGFAGCQVLFPVDPYRNGQEQEQEFGDPIIDSAVGKSVSIITLKWTYGNPATAEFEFERTKLPEDPQQTPPTFSVPVPPSLDVPVQSSFEFDDIGLEAATSYEYRVHAVDSNGDPISNWSDKVAGTTLKFEQTFDAESELAFDAPGWEGRCLVQRIEPARLMLSGTQVRLTLRASSLSDASIDRIYISKVAPALDAWDSAPDLKEVATAVVVPANTAITLPPIDYALDKEQPLLIAVDFTPADPNAAPPGPLSGIRYANPVPPSEARAFFRQGAEAAQIDRSADYTQLDMILLIEKIEVG